MVLSPIDIHNKEFTKGFRGYDQDEVNEFLDQVMKDYEMTIRKTKDLEKELEEMQERVDNYISIEEALNKSIVVAQETAEEVKAGARKESKLIIKEAEKNADRIVDEALNQSKQISMEMEEIKRQTKVYRTRLKMIIEAQLDMVNNEDWESIIDNKEEVEALPE